jgi:ribonuclease HII
MPRHPRPPGPQRQRETELRDAGYSRVAGVDEAGRGPLAGPVVAGAVVLPQDFKIQDFVLLNDSKQLGEAQREELFEKLVRVASWGVGVVEADTIDEINIRQASWLAMQRAVENLHGCIASTCTRASTCDYVLIDGLGYGPGPWPYEAIVKGDGKELCISAASVIAKVWRDRLMLSYDQKFPAYGFARHKGYPTPAHMRALSEHGPCAIHRESFGPVRAVLDAPSA